MKYVPELIFGAAVALFLGYTVSWGPVRPTFAKFQAAELQVEAYRAYAEAAKRKHGNYPSKLDMVRDPWDTPYIYTLQNNVPRICSLGPDSIPNTADDICSK